MAQSGRQCFLNLDGPSEGKRRAASWMAGCVRERGDTRTERMVGTQSAGEQVQPGAQEKVPEGRMVEEPGDQARVHVVGKSKQAGGGGERARAPQEEGAGRPADLEGGDSKRAGETAGPGHTSRRPTLISGAALNCGGPLSRAPAALASLKLGVGELGGFTGSGTRRLGPPVLFPEPGATPPAPAGAAALGSFLGRREGERAQRRGRVRPLQRCMEGEHEEGDWSTHRTADGRRAGAPLGRPTQSLAAKQTQEAGLPYIPRRSQSFLGQSSENRDPLERSDLRSGQAAL